MIEVFRELPEAKLDPIMQAGADWRALQKEHDDPIDTTIGLLYDTATNNIWRPDTVSDAIVETAMDLQNDASSRGYQTQAGEPKLVSGMRDLVFGVGAAEMHREDIVGAQAEGGTGALRLAERMLARSLTERADGSKHPIIVDGGWPNYPNIFSETFDIQNYERSDSESNRQAIMELLAASEPGTTVLLQTCGYNDDGIDRTREQWDEVLDAVAENESPLILDAAYLGLADGLPADRYPIKQSLEKGIVTFVAASASKNMGLYGERVGALFTANFGLHRGADQRARLEQARNVIVRGSYSSPPSLVARAAGRVLTSWNRTNAYLDELEEVQQGLVNKREALAAELGDEFPNIAGGRGLFTKLLPEGFSDVQVAFLRGTGVLALKSSRINIGGIAPRHIGRVGSSIREALDA